jgi:hypothetical protein
MIEVIEKIEQYAKKIANNEHESIRPGMPVTIPDSWMINEGVAQGDLIIGIIDEVPSNYSLVKSPTNLDKQLVPGNTEGAKHCLDSLDGLKLYHPNNWPQSAEETLNGPIIITERNVKVVHPKHGPVTIPSGRTILFQYDKEWDLIQKKERRNLD